MTEPSSATPPAKPSLLGRFWIFLRILNVRLRFILLMVIVGLIASRWDDIMNRVDRWRRPVHVQTAIGAEEIEYYCPMHPNIIRSEPGHCPICGMPLAKRKKGEKGGPVKAYALDNTGARVSAARLEPVEGGVRLVIDGSTPTLHWELVVEE